MTDKEKYQIEKLITILAKVMNKYCNKELEFLNECLSLEHKISRLDKCKADFNTFRMNYKLNIELTFQYTLSNTLHVEKIECYLNKEPNSFLILSIEEINIFGNIIQKASPHLYDLIWLNWK